VLFSYVDLVQKGSDT